MKFITGLEIVSAAQKSPNNYKVILRTSDSGDDADLWRERFSIRKMTRFLCFTHELLKSDGKPRDVLANIVLLNDGDPIPNGFTAITQTVDSKEKSLKRKLFACEWKPVLQAESAITDISVLSQASSLETVYTHLGELHSLHIYFRREANPAFVSNGAAPMAMAFSARPPGRPEERFGMDDTAVKNNGGGHEMDEDNGHGDAIKRTGGAGSSVDFPAFATSRRGTVHPLSGVPFEIAKQFGASGFDIDLSAVLAAASYPHKTADQIEEEFYYNFSLENALTSA